MYIFFEKNALVLGITSTHFQSICIFPVNAIYITLFFFCLTQRLNRRNNGIVTNLIWFTWIVHTVFFWNIVSSVNFKWMVGICLILCKRISKFLLLYNLFITTYFPALFCCFLWSPWLAQFSLISQYLVCFWKVSRSRQRCTYMHITILLNAKKTLNGCIFYKDRSLLRYKSTSLEYKVRNKIFLL